METQNIIIVDDENLTRKALLDGVHWDALGVGQIYEAASAAAAKRILMSQKIDIALIDVEMPEESGIELLEWIRNVLHADMPCAFLTCHASFDYARAAVRLKSFDYLLKPMNYTEVEDLILRMIGTSRSELEQRKISKYGRQWLLERAEATHKHEKCAQKTEEIVDALVVYIRAHLSERLSLTDLAWQAGLNPNYLNKVFKARVGETVNKFIIKERMQLAARLLEEGQAKSYAIAESLGYDNYANFVNMFKKTFGVSPGDYRLSVLADAHKPE